MGMHIKSHMKYALAFFLPILIFSFVLKINAIVLLLAAFVLALPQTFAKNCSPVLPHSGLKFGTLRDAKL